MYCLVYVYVWLFGAGRFVFDWVFPAGYFFCHSVMVFSAGFSPGGGGPPPPKFVLLRIWPPAHWCIILFLLMMTFVACLFLLMMTFVACTAGLITVI